MSPSPLDLTSVSNVKSWLSATGQAPANTSDDANIQACITYFSEMFLWRTGMGPIDGSEPTASLFVQPVTFLNETYDGNGSIRLFLSHRPIQSVASLVVGNKTYTQSTGWGNSGFVIDGTKASISLRGGGSNSYLTYDIGQSPSFFEAVQNVVITYTAGYGSGTILGSSQIVNGGSSYVVNDTFLLSGGLISALGIVTQVVGGVVTACTVLGGSGFLDLQLCTTTATSGVGVGLTLLPIVNGTPAGIELVARKSCALAYRRKDWIGQRSKSLAQGAGTTSYQDYEWEPDVERLILNYSRFAVV